jgi:molybdenum cofactor cytidylyltransferase
MSDAVTRGSGAAAGSRVAGVVPAAGASVRMGTPKGLLPLEGSTFARRVATALRDGGCDPVLFVVRAGDTRLAAEARAAGATVLENPDPGPGPLSSLRLALEQLAGTVDHVVWLPLDHPGVEARTVAALIAEARAHGTPVTLPVHQGSRGHPAVFGRAVFSELLDPELEGGARTVVHRHLGTARLVDTDDPGVLVDVDTPAEYRALVGGDEPDDRRAGQRDDTPTPPGAP